MGTSMNIKIEKPEVDVDNLLNLIGKEFRFDHAKGLSEWLKNSVDAYSLENISDDEQFIYVLFETTNTNLIKSLSVLDFVGMTRAKIDKAFKIWFDPTAARTTNELLKKDIKTLGGHGNGGKFYMREMFKTSQIITYRDGHLNLFGFNEKKQYGFHTKYNNELVSIDKAIDIAKLDQLNAIFPIISPILYTKKRFTLVNGMVPKAISRTNYLNKLIDGLIVHPQARRIIQRKKVFLFYDAHINPIRLQTPSIKPKPGFEIPLEFFCPQEIKLDSDVVVMSTDYENTIKLILSSSELPLKGHKFKGLNSIDFLSDIGVIANYDISSLGYINSSNYSEFIYGECYCDVFEKEDLVRNDRDKLVDSPKTQALLKWVKECLEFLCGKMDEKLKNEQKNLDLKQTSLYNDLLNRWKNRFLNKLFKEGFGGDGDSGMDGSLEDKIVYSTNKVDKDANKERKAGDKGGNEKRKGNKFPQVKISGYDIDPITNEILHLDSRQFAIHQRPIDVQMGIYWINTSKKIAQLILQKHNANSIHWREYLFHRFMDIIIKESIYNKGRQDVDLTADIINNEIDNRISENTTDLAAEDLKEFLFERDFQI